MGASQPAPAKNKKIFPPGGWDGGGKNFKKEVEVWCI